MKDKIIFHIEADLPEDNSDCVYFLKSLQNAIQLVCAANKVQYKGYEVKPCQTSHMDTE